MMNKLFEGKTLPVIVVVAAIIAIWYCFTVYLNTPWQLDRYEKAGTDWTYSQLITDTMKQERPVLPSVHQVVIEIWQTTVNKKITSKRSLIYHGWITLATTLFGFLFGTILGITLAVLIVHNNALDRSLMPWIIASQTIPILAIAPMVIVVLNAIDLPHYLPEWFNKIAGRDLFPKGLISTYLSFFPIAVGMVKGLRSPDLQQLDLMHTYNASQVQTFWKLRWPNSVPYLFTSMKVAVAISLVGAIVGELPTGAVAGLGARLLAGSYYGQTVQIWSALISAAVLAAVLVMLVGVANNIVLKRMGMSQ